ncbi:MAG: DUF2628 domain-containing protein [Rickettsiales bacterium]|nr:DUF2628 domain-containing protein [Rickettsiales bacterium]
MDFYTIYIKNNQENIEPIAIKEGFNWYSLIFNLFWSIYKKTWILATTYLVIQIILILLQAIGLNNLLIKTLTVLIYVLIAFHANDFYRYSLELKGYKLVDVILAKSSSHATYNFLKNPTQTTSTLESSRA